MIVALTNPNTNTLLLGTPINTIVIAFVMGSAASPDGLQTSFLNVRIFILANGITSLLGGHIVLRGLVSGNPITSLKQWTSPAWLQFGPWPDIIWSAFFDTLAIQIHTMSNIGGLKANMWEIEYRLEMPGNIWIWSLLEEAQFLIMVFNALPGGRATSRPVYAIQKHLWGPGNCSLSPTSQ